METKLLPVSGLKPAPYNPRKALKPGDKAYEKLKNSIMEFGLVQPIVVNERTGHVVGGHQRLQVLIDSGARTAAHAKILRGDFYAASWWAAAQADGAESAARKPGQTGAAEKRAKAEYKNAGVPDVVAPGRQERMAAHSAGA